ncbi:UPF0058 family protein [Haladaptatus caseinilyticus]|uniref:UPF0058 family protein n=1 Tax=Haladaptatus caseinilyticus TaxID=2993314 RepID=UPI00224B35DB|nr:UPF0058 family protein [Haladaptatus caseinilyticus]
MKKQELIHLHGLLVEIRNNYKVRNEETLDFQDYDSAGVHPTSIHHSKSDHKKAVFKLANGLTREMTAQETEQIPQVH